MERGDAVTLAPHFPELDERLIPHSPKLSLPPSAHGIPTLLGLHRPALQQAVETARKVLDLAQERLSPTTLYPSLLRDDAGVPRVAFVINPSDDDVDARWLFDEHVAARNALTGAALKTRDSAVTLTAAKRSVTMLELDWLS
jgi:hypothetical protein